MYVKHFHLDFFINFVVRMWHLGLFYTLMEHLKDNLKHIYLLFYLKVMYN